MSNVIDEFCKCFNLSLGELAENLNIKQPQINNWKSGTRKIPQHHKEKMYKIFNIPFNKHYLLEVDYVDSIIRLEIELIYLHSINEPTEKIKVIEGQIDLERDLLKIRGYLQTKSKEQRKQIINQIANTNKRI